MSKPKEMLKRIAYEILANAADGIVDTGHSYECAEVEELTYDERTQVAVIIRSAAREMHKKASKS